MIMQWAVTVREGCEAHSRIMNRFRNVGTDPNVLCLVSVRLAHPMLTRDTVHKKGWWYCADKHDASSGVYVVAG